MLTGYNTDIDFKGTIYHVQTEDKGVENPVIETLLYVGGQILDSVRTVYSELSGSDYNTEKVEKLMEEQHREMIKKIRSGYYEKDMTTETVEIKPEKTEQEDVPTGEDTSRTLDEVILEYLEKEAEKAKLELGLQEKVSFVAGDTVEVKVLARNSLTRTPMKNVDIVVKVISTVKEPEILFEGKSGESGTAAARVTLPELNGGNAAIIIRGKSELGGDEIKQLIKKKA